MENLDSLLRDARIVITDSEEAYIRLEQEFGIPSTEIRFIDLNRTGIFLPNKEVKVGFRARFLTEIEGINGKRKTYFALPVREKGDTHFSVYNNKLRFNETIFGKTEEVCLDTCDISYSRGPNLINLNSRRRGNCGGCKACVHHYKNLYDNTVLKDTESLVTFEQISSYFSLLENQGFNIPGLEQIAVVTGLFEGEDKVLEHLSLLSKIASSKGFRGELLYFGCELNSKDSLKQFADIGNTALVYAIDNFTKREAILNPVKSRISLKLIKRTIENAREQGINVTYSYIAGIDPLRDMISETKDLGSLVSRFPIINIYQIQTHNQAEIMDCAAKKLEYYLEMRLLIENIFKGKNLMPRKWENYRPLWYDYFMNKPF